MTAMLKLEVDGRAVEVPQEPPSWTRHPTRDLRAPFLLSQEAFHCGQLPHVPGTGGKGAQADAGMRNAGDGGMKSGPVGAGAARAEQRDGVSAHQSSAGLPDL